MAATARVGPNDTAPPNSSGIQVIVVGTGLGGLSAAVECHRKGHSVIVFDKLSEITRISMCAFHACIRSKSRKC